MHFHILIRLICTDMLAKIQDFVFIYCYKQQKLFYSKALSILIGILEHYAHYNAMPQCVVKLNEF